MKNCGACHWCCYHPAAAELKERSEWCRYFKEGLGCKIYADRPEACRTFACVWLQDAVMPEEFRPDRCGVMFEVPYRTKMIVGLVDPQRPEAWKAKRVQQLVRKFINAGYPVKIRIS